jgi:hypothetical protein
MVGHCELSSRRRMQSAAVNAIRIIGKRDTDVTQAQHCHTVTPSFFDALSIVVLPKKASNCDCFKKEYNQYCVVSAIFSHKFRMTGIALRYSIAFADVS